MVQFSVHKLLSNNQGEPYQRNDKHMWWEASGLAEESTMPTTLLCNCRVLHRQMYLWDSFGRTGTLRVFITYQYALQNIIDTFLSHSYKRRVNCFISPLGNVPDSFWSAFVVHCSCGVYKSSITLARFASEKNMTDCIPIDHFCPWGISPQPKVIAGCCYEEGELAIMDLFFLGCCPADLERTFLGFCAHQCNANTWPEGASLLTDWVSFHFEFCQKRFILGHPWSSTKGADF